MSRTKKDHINLIRDELKEKFVFLDITGKSKIKKSMSKIRRAKEKNALRTGKDVQVFKKDILYWYF